jgi:hypothetical protein
MNGKRWNRFCILALALGCPVFGEVKATFSPAPGYKLPHIVWNVTACVKDAAAPGAVIRSGDLYTLLSARKIGWLTQSQAVAELQAAPARSLPARLVRYGGYASAAAAFLLGTSVIKASAVYTGILATASGAINVVLPLATKAEPPVPTEVQSGLLGPFLVVPAGGCAAAIVIAGPGEAFEEVIP